MNLGKDMIDWEAILSQVRQNKKLIHHHFFDCLFIYVKIKL
jgi:hypothetical protein